MILSRWSIILFSLTTQDKKVMIVYNKHQKQEEKNMIVDQKGNMTQ